MVEHKGLRNIKALDVFDRKASNTFLWILKILRRKWKELSATIPRLLASETSFVHILAIVPEKPPGEQRAQKSSSHLDGVFGHLKRGTESNLLLSKRLRSIVSPDTWDGGQCRQNLLALRLLLPTSTSWRYFFQHLSRLYRLEDTVSRVTAGWRAWMREDYSSNGPCYHVIKFLVNFESPQFRRGKL